MRAFLAAIVTVAVLAGGAMAAPVEPYDAWRVDLASSYSHLTKGLAPWRSSSLALTYRPAPTDWLTAAVDRVSQFGLTDNVFSFNAVRTFAGKASFGGGFGVTSKAHFRPKYSFHLNGQTKPLWATASGLRLALAGDISTARYRTGTVSSIQPALVLTDWRGDGLTLKGIATRDETGRTLTGYALRGETPITRSIRASLTYVNAPESDIGVTVKSSALSGALLVDLPRAFTLRLSATQEWRTLFNRSELGLGLIRTF